MHKNTEIQTEARRIKLSEDFTLHRYGIDVRLANEDDSEFILSLRTDERLSRFIHSTDADVEKQRQWMRNYKEREIKGEDYYFIYSRKGKLFGVNRIYDVKSDSATGGSWVCKQGTEVEFSMASLLIMRDIMFEELNLEADNFDVRKGNKKVQRVHLMLGAKQVGETDLDNLYTLSREDYQKNKTSFMQLLNIEE